MYGDLDYLYNVLIHVISVYTLYKRNQLRVSADTGRHHEAIEVGDGGLTTSKLLQRGRLTSSGYTRLHVSTEPASSGPSTLHVSMDPSRPLATLRSCSTESFFRFSFFSVSFLATFFSFTW